MAKMPNSGPTPHRWPSDARIVANMFVPSRLTAARELAGRKKKDLAALVGKSAAAISQFESGDIRPDPTTLQALAAALRMPVSYFGIPQEAPSVALENCHFRAKRSVSQFLRRKSIRAAETLLDLVHELDDLVEFPTERVSDAVAAIGDTDDMDGASMILRRHWGLGTGPIHGIIKHIESRGVIVLPLADDCDDVDAFSLWARGRPVIMLAAKNASRTQFDVAHELAHLLLHHDFDSGDPYLETQANQFASSFLMPKETFLRECPIRWDINAFLALKARWHVSIQAMLYRAQSLGHISSYTYKGAMIEMSASGQRKREAGEWGGAEKPTALLKALAAVSDEVSRSELAARIGVHEIVLEELLQPLLACPVNRNDSVPDEELSTHWT